MKIDYQGEYKKQLQSNILLVREQIDNEDFVLKITNHAIKYDREYSEVKSKILTDDMYAEIFAKDPAKQINKVSEFRNLPNSAKVFVVGGKITSERLNDVKSIDFVFKIGDKNIYASHKYIKATNGGAQDNQYNDIRNFLRNCDKISSGNDYYLAICDGPYFDTKIKVLNEDFGSSNVKALTIDYLEDFINSL